MTEKLNIGVLISGGGSNLQALIDAAEDKNYPAQIACVISNKAEVFGLERADKAGIPSFIVSHKGVEQKVFENAIHLILQQNSIDLICLAGFMRILSEEFISKWQNRILNIHPALLPKFGGKGMYGHHVHDAVIHSGEKESGASVHIVTAGCDEGPVILQKSVPVEHNDTSDMLAARVLEVEHEIYPLALAQYAAEISRKTD